MYSDYKTDTYGYDNKMQRWSDHHNDIPVISITLYGLDGLKKVLDYLLNLKDEFTTRSLWIYCAEGQLTEADIQAIFSKHKYL